MASLKFWSKDKDVVQKSALPPTDEVNSDFFTMVGAGSTYALGSIDNRQRLKFFMNVPEVNAIINLRSRAAGNLQIAAVDRNGKEIPMPSDDILDLIEEGNYFQSKSEVFGQTTLFKDIFGDEFLYIAKNTGQIGFNGIFTLPPPLVEVIADKSGSPILPFYMYDKMPRQIQYKYKHFDGRMYDLRETHLVHTTYNDVHITDEKDVYTGMSKLDALQAPIENIIAAYEARNVLIVNRGAIGILSNGARDAIGGAAPMDKKEREKIQEQFKRYGLTKNQWQVIITNLALSWQQMAIDVDKLKLFEETREDTLKICDEYGTPYELLSSIRNTTFDNKKEAQRQWYRDTIIPESAARIAAINRKFGFRSKGYSLIPKFDHLPIFEEERRQRSQSLYQLVNALSKALEDGVIDQETYAEELRKFGIKAKR